MTEPTVMQLLDRLEAFAPSRLAETWDNVGLLLGDPKSPIRRVMTCLTVTAMTAREAIDEGADAIVSHHPIMFRPIKSLRADRASDGFVWELARAGIAVLSPHTAFDNAIGGVNDVLSVLLGLVNVGPLREGSTTPRYKIAVFCPREDRDKVSAAAFAAGAGRIGAYDECSFSSSGYGTFLGTEGANPTIGTVGRRETVREWRVEFVCEGRRLDPVLAAIRQSHSYEEPAIDVYPLAALKSESPGVGRIGEFSKPTSLEETARRSGRVLQAESVQYAGDPAKLVRRLAIVCGAGDDFVPDAVRAGADALLTGEARFHRALEAEAAGLGLITAGHHATERPGVESLADRLAAEFPGIAVWASRVERDPLRSAPARLADGERESP